MGPVAQLNTLLTSDIDALLSQVDAPERALNQMLLDLKDHLIEMKKQVAVAAADEKRLRKQLEGERAPRSNTSHANTACHDDDALAREYHQLKASTDTLHAAMRDIQKKLQEVHREKTRRSQLRLSSATHASRRTRRERARPRRFDDAATHAQTPRDDT